MKDMKTCKARSEKGWIKWRYKDLRKYNQTQKGKRTGS